MDRKRDLHATNRNLECTNESKRLSVHATILGFADSTSQAHLLSQSRISRLDLSSAQHYLPTEDDQRICVVVRSYRPWDLLTIIRLTAFGILK